MKKYLLFTVVFISGLFSGIQYTKNSKPAINTEFALLVIQNGLLKSEIQRLKTNRLLETSAACFELSKTAKTIKEIRQISVP